MLQREYGRQGYDTGSKILMLDYMYIGLLLGTGVATLHMAERQCECENMG